MCHISRSNTNLSSFNAVTTVLDRQGGRMSLIETDCIRAFRIIPGFGWVLILNALHGCCSVGVQPTDTDYDRGFDERLCAAYRRCVSLGSGFWQVAAGGVQITRILVTVLDNRSVHERRLIGKLGL